MEAIEPYGDGLLQLVQLRIRLLRLLERHPPAELEDQLVRKKHVERRRNTDEICRHRKYPEHPELMSSSGLSSEKRPRDGGRGQNRSRTTAQLTLPHLLLLNSGPR